MADTGLGANTTDSGSLWVSTSGSRAFGIVAVSLTRVSISEVYDDVESNGYFNFINSLRS